MARALEDFFRAYITQYSINEPPGEPQFPMAIGTSRRRILRRKK
jgi:hypothetical protein